jgi:hypothetical protein
LPVKSGTEESGKIGEDCEEFKNMGEASCQGVWAYDSIIVASVEWTLIVRKSCGADLSFDREQSYVLLIPEICSFFLVFVGAPVA